MQTDVVFIPFTFDRKEKKKKENKIETWARHGHLNHKGNGNKTTFPGFN